MKRVFKMFFLLVVVLCFATMAYAQAPAAKTAAKPSEKSGSGQVAKPADNMQILRDKIKADKKLVVAENMELTEAEAKAFWPVYEAYQKDLQAINRRLITTVQGYAEAFNANTMDNEKAKKLMTATLAIQADEVKLMKNYAPKLAKVLSAVKVARYLQIENKIRAVIKYEMAAEIPLVQTK